MDIRWNDRGDRLGFVSEEKILWVYDLLENKTDKVFEFNYGYYFKNRFDFVFDGRKLVAINNIDHIPYLYVFDEYFSEEKTIKLPISPDYYYVDSVTGFNNFIFLTIDGRKTEVWRIDLNTEEWKKIYP